MAENCQNYNGIITGFFAVSASKKSNFKIRNF